MNPNHARHHDRVFFLTEDIEKTHYSYDLITGPGSQSIDRDLKCSRTWPPCRRCRARQHAPTCWDKGRSLTMKSHRMTLLIVLLVLTFCTAAWAQDSASLTGTVTDASGAAISNAQVAVSNTAQGISRKATTNSGGDFLFA